MLHFVFSIGESKYLLSKFQIIRKLFYCIFIIFNGFYTHYILAI